MTRNEARKIIKSHAPSKYSNSAVLLLLKLVDATYRKDKDNAERETETTTATLMRAAAIGDKQLRRILEQLTEDGVLLDVRRTAKHVTCHINLKALSVLPVFGDVQKADKKAQGEARTQAARERRQTVREISQTVNQTGDALNADLHEKTIKEALLADVKDHNVRRMMLNWDIPRIQRAKFNAERLTTGEAI
jgi:hypothetical protein